MRGKLLLEWPRFLKDFLDILCISVGAIQGNKKFPSKNVLCYSIVQLTSNLEILVAYHTTVWINVPCYTMVLAKTQFYVLVTEFRFLVSWFFFLASSSSSSSSIISFLYSIDLRLFYICVSSSRPSFDYLHFGHWTSIFFHFSPFHLFLLYFTIFINVVVQNIIYIKLSSISIYLPAMSLNKCINTLIKDLLRNNLVLENIIENRSILVRLQILVWEPMVLTGFFIF